VRDYGGEQTPGRSPRGKPKLALFDSPLEGALRPEFDGRREFAAVVDAFAESGVGRTRSIV
jgi:hypothetical protein